MLLFSVSSLVSLSCNIENFNHGISLHKLWFRSGEILCAIPWADCCGNETLFTTSFSQKIPGIIRYRTPCLYCIYSWGNVCNNTASSFNALIIQ
jgi:hypothetical protein